VGQAPQRETALDQDQSTAVGEQPDQVVDGPLLVGEVWTTPEAQTTSIDAGRTGSAPTSATAVRTRPETRSSRARRRAWPTSRASRSTATTDDPPSSRCAKAHEAPPAPHPTSSTHRGDAAVSAHATASSMHGRSKSRSGRA
jgi:hypothetical protein